MVLKKSSKKRNSIFMGDLSSIPILTNEKLSGLAFYLYGLSLFIAGLRGRTAGGFDGDKLQVFVHVCAGAVNGNGARQG